MTPLNPYTLQQVEIFDNLKQQLIDFKANHHLTSNYSRNLYLRRNWKTMKLHYNIDTTHSPDIYLT